MTSNKLEKSNPQCYMDQGIGYMGKEEIGKVRLNIGVIWWNGDRINRFHGNFLLSNLV